jgi:hypothetical protein
MDMKKFLAWQTKVLAKAYSLNSSVWAKSIAVNSDKSRNVILKAWGDCSIERKQTLCKTDDQSVNIPALQHFKKCFAVDTATLQTNSCRRKMGNVNTIFCTLATCLRWSCFSETLSGQHIFLYQHTTDSVARIPTMCLPNVSQTCFTMQWWNCTSDTNIHKEVEK